jgi:hypothetical protein
MLPSIPAIRFVKWIFIVLYVRLQEQRRQRIACRGTAAATPLPYGAVLRGGVRCAVWTLAALTPYRPVWHIPRNRSR